MKKDPCKTCLVRACCKIRKMTVWYKCGCDPYEIYSIWKVFNNYCDKNEYLTQLMTNSNHRMQELKAAVG